jgi:hypothetical protein
MRGPGYRLDLDVRRTWTCPQCGAVRKAMGEVTSLECVTCNPGRLMVITGERIVAPRPVTEFDPHAERVPKADPADEPLAPRQPKLMKGSKSVAKRALGDFGDETANGQEAETLGLEESTSAGQVTEMPVQLLDQPLPESGVTPLEGSSRPSQAASDAVSPPAAADDEEDDFGAGVDLP